MRAETQDETDQTLIDDLLALGSELQIPRFDDIKERDITRAIQLTLSAIEQSGTETPWLLIYDNAEKPKAIEKLTPRSGAHLLITSRWPHWRGRAEPLAVEVFPPEIAIDYLLEDAPFRDREAAARLAEALGYLPLALSHARAYCIESHLDFDAYGARIAERIKEAPGGTDYPDTVFTTFNLAMDEVAEKCPEAEKLVSAVAFLSSDQIPVSLFTEDFIDEDALNKTLATLSNVSLITYETLDGGARGFSVHRLVQAVMRTRLGSEEQDALSLALELVLAGLPKGNSVGEHAQWFHVKKIQPHALSVLEYLPKNDGTTDAAFLCSLIGFYRQARAAFDDAEPLYTRALAIYEAALGPDHPNTAATLNNLAELHRAQGRHDEAEPLLDRAIAIYEAALEPDHTSTAISLNNLALLHHDRGRHDEAESLYARALAMYEAAPGSDHPLSAATLNNLAGLHHDRGRHDEAEPLLAHALSIREAALGPDHPYTAATLNNLAELHCDRGRYDEAEPLFARALAICEAALGPDHPHTQTVRKNYERLKADRAGQEEAD